MVEQKGVSATEEKSTATADAESEVKETEDLETEEVKGDEEKTIGELTTPLADSPPVKEEEVEVTEDSEDADAFIDSLMDKTDDQTEEDKTNLQKRMDSLYGKSKNLEEENASLRDEISRLKESDSKSTGKKEYSKAELQTAMKNAIIDQDADLMMAILDYQGQQIEKKLIRKYESEQQKNVEQSKQKAMEMASIVEDYGKYSNAGNSEIYPGSREELDINNPDSTLVRLAVKLYKDPKRAGKYNRPGGAHLAVADALNMIITGRLSKSSPETKETKRLKNALKKERRKRSITSTGKALKQETAPPKPKTDKERLDEYIKESKALQEKRRNPLFNIKEK